MAAPALDPKTPGEYALAYAAMGWAVVPLHFVVDGKCSCGDPHDGSTKLGKNSIGKHPHGDFARHGVHSASKDAATIAAWWNAEPRLNVGIATGEASGFDAVDIDPRNGGAETWDQFTAPHGGEPDTVKACTGGAGRHILLRYDGTRILRRPGKGVDIKSDGGLIVVEPSNHVSGRTYSWDAECDPTQGAVIADAPEWLTVPRDEKNAVVTMEGRAVGIVPPARMTELVSALRYINPESRDTWRDVGAALHSTGDPTMFGVWCDWSKRCEEKYTDRAQRDLWSGFSKNQYRGKLLHIESIFRWAIDAGWPGVQPEAVPLESVRIAEPVVTKAAPPELLALPGALGLFVDWINATSERPQPTLAVSAALAMGSAACGRRYKTTRNNFSSLYFLNVGQSGSGKEYPRTAINSALMAADWPQLIGPAGFSSDSAVVSSLLIQPSHIAMIDEIGAILGNMQAEGAYIARSAMTSLVEAWGNLHGFMKPKALSLLNASKEQIDRALTQIIYNPALTLLAMTTPQTFYKSLTESSIEGGFLSRLIVVETDIGRQMPRTPEQREMPAPVVQWLKSVRNHSASQGNLAAFDVPAGAKPEPTMVAILPTAKVVFDDYLRETIDRANELENEGMAELEVRSVEKAMRLALILAVSSDPVEPSIGRFEAEWACAYIRHWTARTVVAVRTNMHGGKFAQWQADALKFIAKGGKNGRTEAELPRYSRTFNNLEPRQRRMVLDALATRGSIALVEIKSTAGRKRAAWVAVDEENVSVDKS